MPQNCVVYLRKLTFLPQIDSGCPALLFHNQLFGFVYEIENKDTYTLILLGRFFRYSFLSMAAPLHTSGEEDTRNRPAIPGVFFSALPELDAPATGSRFLDTDRGLFYGRTY